MDQTFRCGSTKGTRNTFRALHMPASTGRAGYQAHPRTDALSASAFLPLDRLTNALTYPTDVNEVRAFYTESEKLVRFLSAADKPKFLQLLDRLAKGSLFENALHTSYGPQFASVHQLEEAFRPYATQPAAVANAGTGAPMLQQ